MLLLNVVLLILNNSIFCCFIFVNVNCLRNLPVVEIWNKDLKMLHFTHLCVCYRKLFILVKLQTGSSYAVHFKHPKHMKI